MKVLKEIFRDAGLNTNGNTICREAVRGIALRQRDILMVYSPVNGDYKFPGGGVDPGESDQEALAREVREECGAQLSRIERGLGCVIEYARPKEADYDLFKMTSRYYLCGIEGDFRGQQLDRYERELGFRPVWVNIDFALHTNTDLLHRSDRRCPQWTVRETFVLEYINNSLVH